MTNSARLRVDVIRALERYRVMIVGYAYAITRDHHLAEDVFQEVAVVVAERPQRLPDDDGAGRWLREVSRRKSLELLRRSRRQGVLFEEEVLVQLGDAFAEKAPNEHHARLKAAMSACVDGLGGDARTVVCGRYVEGAACETIADRIGRSVQAVYAVLKRTRLSLARCVEKRLVAEDDR